MNSTFATTFQRKEVKYRLSAQQLARVRAMISGHLRPTEFGNQHIISVYLDTPDRSLISHSLEKPLYKEKLRLRAYGNPTGSDRAFIELKKKFKGIVYKRRAPLSLSAGCAFLKGASWDEACRAFPFLDEDGQPVDPSSESRQIAAEIEAYRVRHGELVPSMGIRCRREAYTSVSDDVPVRITFDHEISYCDYLEPRAQKSGENTLSGAGSPDEPCEETGFTVSSNSANTGITASGNGTEQPTIPLLKPLLEPGACIMEIKVSGAMPLWLSTALTACQVFPSSFSKYGEAYRACVHAAAPRVAAQAQPAQAHSEKTQSAPRNTPAHARRNPAGITPVFPCRKPGGAHAAQRNAAPSPANTTIKEKAHA